MKNAVNTPAINALEVFAALEAWINKRPGLDARDYGFDANGRSAYRSELRDIANDKKRALKALDEARALEPMPDLLADAFKRAFSGRLEWIHCTCAEHKDCPHCKDGEKMVCANCSQCTRCGGHADGCKGCPLSGGKLPHLDYCTGQYFPTEYRKAAASVLEAYISAWRQKANADAPRTFSYVTLADVKAANQAIGNSWFSRSNMRFFNTKIESGLIGGKRFITSDRMDENRPKRYTVREAQPDGSIDTVGELQGYSFLEDARIAARALPQK